MRLSLLTLAASAVFGLAFSASDASACHKKKACATPAVCAAPAPAPVAGAPAKAKKKCFGGHKRRAAVCAAPAAPCGGGCETGMASYAAPVSYGAPVYATGQATASGQGY